MSRPGQPLTDALLRMAGNGQRPRCGEWSDHSPARLCDACPILGECAQDETKQSNDDGNTR